MLLEKMNWHRNMSIKNKKLNSERDHISSTCSYYRSFINSSRSNNNNVIW